MPNCSGCGNHIDLDVNYCTCGSEDRDDLIAGISYKLDWIENSLDDVRLTTSEREEFTKKIVEIKKEFEILTKESEDDDS